MNLSPSSNLQSSIPVSERTEVNVGQETLSIIDYIDDNFPILKKNVFEWGFTDVTSWLKHIGLEEYMDIFAENRIFGKNLFLIKEEELKKEFLMNSVGHRKNFMHSVDFLRKIYMENKGRRLSIIRNKLAQFYYKKRPLINWKTKKVKSVCDVIEEEVDDTGDMKSLPEENEINEKYKALKKDGFLNSPMGGKGKRDEEEGVEEEKNEMEGAGGMKGSKSNSTLEKSPNAKEEAKNDVLEDRNFRVFSVFSVFFVYFRFFRFFEFWSF